MLCYAMLCAMLSIPSELPRRDITPAQRAHTPREADDGYSPRGRESCDALYCPVWHSDSRWNGPIQRARSDGRGKPFEFHTPHHNTTLHSTAQRIRGCETTRVVCRERSHGTARVVTHWRLMVLHISNTYGVWIESSSLPTPFTLLSSFIDPPPPPNQPHWHHVSPALLLDTTRSHHNPTRIRYIISQLPCLHKR